MCWEDRGKGMRRREFVLTCCAVLRLGPACGEAIVELLKGYLPVRIEDHP